MKKYSFFNGVSDLISNKDVYEKKISDLQYFPSFRRIANFVIENKGSVYSNHPFQFTNKLLIRLAGCVAITNTDFYYKYDMLEFALYLQINPDILIDIYGDNL